MNQAFILQNQNQHFFGKNKDWVDGYDASSLFKTEHKDEAINQMVEISSKDYTQRVRVIACNLDEKGLPLIDIDIMPPPLPKAPKAAKTSDIPASVVDLFAAKAIDIDNEDGDIENIDTVEDPLEDSAGEQKPLM